jgi:hypothetical protein
MQGKNLPIALVCFLAYLATCYQRNSPIMHLLFKALGQPLIHSKSKRIQPQILSNNCITSVLIVITQQWDGASLCNANTIHLMGSFKK